MVDLHVKVAPEGAFFKMASKFPNINALIVKLFIFLKEICLIHDNLLLQSLLKHN